MAKYLIHACRQRLDYVNGYLIPSMIQQGIDLYNIAVYLDAENEGCLESCMKAFLDVPIDDNGTWHMQDDVIICSDFKQRTEELDDRRIVCGFCYDGDAKKEYAGLVDVEQLWYSFPCIHIPNIIARGCADWWFRYAKHNNEFKVWRKMRRYDDSVFDVYLRDYWEDEKILNLTPNLVDHVDYLIGGSITNKERVEKETHAAYFNDTYLIDELKKKIS